MQAIRQTQQLNKRELENATPPSASWHADYRDTAWVYVGGLPFDLTEGDVVIIFSQFGNPTHLNLVRDRETGKSKGFGFLKYEDQRSCDLAVDNLSGAEVLGKLLRVDHTRYKKREDEDDDTYRIDRLEAEAAAEQTGKRASDTEESDDERQRRKRRKAHVEDTKRLAIKEHGESTASARAHDDIDVDEQRARDRHRDRKHKHRHRDRTNKEDGSRGLDDSEGERDERARGGNIERDRKHQSRKSEDRQRSRRDESLSRERPPRSTRDHKESTRRVGTNNASERDRDRRGSRHRRRSSSSRSPERKLRNITGSDDEVDRYRGSRNGKTRHADRSRD